MKQEHKNAEEKMSKSVNALIADYAAIRAGSANASLLNKINVMYYGSNTPLNGVASISTPDPRTLYITPFDASVLKDIEKAIMTSDLGINPQNDGKGIRLSIPPLTEERRLDLVKQVHKRAEDAKVAIRAIRRDSIEKYKAMKKKSEITEDELKSGEKDMQVLHDKFIKEVENLSLAKEKELKAV